MTLVDSNVLLDILTSDPVWLHWSVESLDRRAAKGELFINEVIFAELSVRSDSQRKLERALDIFRVKLDRTSTEALYLAGKIFGRYRSSGGNRTGVLPDFFIGAHAQIAHLPILTRDTRRYRSYFPKVELIAPDA